MIRLFICATTFFTAFLLALQPAHAQKSPAVSVVPAAGPVLTDSTAFELMTLFQTKDAYENAVRLNVITMFPRADVEKVKAQANRLLAGPAKFEGGASKQIAALMKKFLNDAEGKELVRYLKSPLGQKYLALPILIRPEFSKLTMDIVHNSAPELEKNLASQKPPAK